MDTTGLRQALELNSTVFMSWFLSLSKIFSVLGATEMAQLAKCPPCEQRDMSVISRIHSFRKSQVWWYMPINPVMRRQRLVDSSACMGSSLPYLMSSRPVRNKVNNT